MDTKPKKTRKRQDVTQPQPVLFGAQESLLRAARDGATRVSDINKGANVRVGLCVAVRPAHIGLNVDHPAFPEIRAVLEDLLQEPITAPETGTGTAIFDHGRPLGHPDYVPFRLLLAFAQSTEPMERGNLYKRLPDISDHAVRNATLALVERGALVRRDDDRYELSDSVPTSFRRLLLRLAEISNDPVLKAT
jgi:hypothetical protein